MFLVKIDLEPSLTVRGLEEAVWTTGQGRSLSFMLSVVQGQQQYPLGDVRNADSWALPWTAWVGLTSP